MFVLLAFLVVLGLALDPLVPDLGLDALFGFLVPLTGDGLTGDAAGAGAGAGLTCLAGLETFLEALALDLEAFLD